ncbi:winged helix-turn-helix transcriptional regulator [Candidatus Woesearchaeota archaeon]|nr:winged helix-turn-helix transcriptional regulator [Candidatus Woesearchaeota archaeon]
MAREKFLLVSLEEQQAKHLEDVISNETSRKIINHLSEKEDVTETQLAKELNMPLSTVHYNLQKLKEAQLVNVETFHYSSKGREVDHYRLANKYVIITPKPVKGIKTHLKNILPIAFAMLGISWIIKLIQGSYFAAQTLAPVASQKMMETMPITAQKAVESTAMTAPAMMPEAGLDMVSDAEITTSARTFTSGVQSTSEFISQNVTHAAEAVKQEPNIALWFFIGGMMAILLFYLISTIRKRI